jgi:MoaA/NifB/PqqE/SkfB family radical SAM enzyme
VDDSCYATKATAGQVILWRDRGPILGRMDMELTERCNLDCVHCYINQPAGDRDIRAREMSTEQVKTILREAAALGCLTVRFTGGEPMLREDFQELYLYARRLGLKVMIFTNATLITPRLADLLARVPPLERIEITVYGMSPESYKAVTRVTGAYQAAQRGMQLLLERQVPFVVKGGLVPANAKEAEAFEAWAATLPWMDDLPSYAVNFDLRARRDSEEKNEIIRGIRLSPGASLPPLERRSEAYRKEMAEFCSKFIGPPGDRLFSCGVGHGACVDAYGRAQLCMLLRHPDTVLNLLEMNNKSPLRNALTDFFPRVLGMCAQNPDYLARCARCFLKGLCEQCPGKAWMEHGTLDKPVAYLCAVAHTQAEQLGLLHASENAWEVVDWKDRVTALHEEEVLKLALSR